MVRKHRSNFRIAYIISVVGNSRTFHLEEQVAVMFGVELHKGDKCLYALLVEQPILGTELLHLGADTFSGEFLQNRRVSQLGQVLFHQRDLEHQSKNFG